MAYRASRAENWIPIDDPRARDIIDRLERRDIKQLRENRNEAYWSETKHIWLEALQVYMLGHKARKLMLQTLQK